MTARVVIHIDENGSQRVFSDGDVEVFFVDEGCPRDRVYRASPNPVPDGMIYGCIGHMDDGTPMDLRAKVFAAELSGASHLSLVDGGAQ